MASEPYNGLHNDQILETVDEEADLQRSDSLESMPSSSRSDSGSSLQSDLDKLDHEEIILNLADLHTESTALLSLFDRPNDEELEKFIDETLRKGSRPQKTLSMRAKKLSTSLEPFGSSEFIDPPLIVRKLAGNVELHRINYGRWRPDAILYLANLAHQMVAAVNDSPDDRENLLSYLYNNFPNPFVGQREFSFGTQLVDETRDLTIDMMTQLFIQKLDSDGMKHFSSPQELAHHIFRDTTVMYRHFQDKDSQELLLQRLNDLENCCAIDNDLLPPLDRLKRDYPWPSFVLRTAVWTLARAEELKETIRRQGGVENIVDLLNSGDYEVDVKRGPTIHLDGSLKISDAGGPGPVTEPRLSANRSSVSVENKRSSAALSPTWYEAEVRQLREEQAKHAREISRLESPHSGSSTAQEPQEIPQSSLGTDEEDDYRPLQADDDDEVDSTSQNLSDVALEVDNNRGTLIPSQSTNIVMNVLKKHAMEREKQNQPLRMKRTLLDRQPDARQVQWESQELNDTQEGQSARPHEKVPVEISDEEEEYEEDTRPSKRHRVDKGKQPVPQNTQRSRHDGDSTPAIGFHDDDDLGDYADENDDADNRSQDGHRLSNNRSVLTSMESRLSNSRPAAASSSQPTVRSHQRPQTTTSRKFPPQSSAPVAARNRSPPQSQYEDAQQTARKSIQLRKEIHQRRKPQVRRPWTDAEMKRLEEMVARYGTQWAYIKEMDNSHEDGPELQGRDQVALKDKARNMKIVHLKNCNPLPLGFEHVSVGPKLLKPLEDLGIKSARNARFTRASADKE